jgi:hypothetical protein
MTVAGIAVAIHQLPRRRDQVLAVAALVGGRSQDAWFTPASVVDAFEDLRLPAPGNVSQELGRLRQHELVVRRRTGGTWSLTELGRRTLREMIGEIDTAQVDAELAKTGSAVFDRVPHPLIPAELAPARFLPGVGRLLERFPFETNVFGMTRFPSGETPDPSDPLAGTIDAVRSSLAERGMTLHLASDRTTDDELFGNVAAHLWSCKYGIALLETRLRSDLNDNVLIELGAMLVTGRRCALLKDVETPALPSDFVAQLYKEVDFADAAAVSAAVADWVTDDLAVSERGAS